jgi:mannan endo-1,6-alpha-mannosidase
MLSFKGYVHRWLAVTAQLAPFTKERIMNTLRTSTKAAVSQCTGGQTGRVCGFKWLTGVYDGTNGAGEEMNVLGALLSLLVDSAPGPLTNLTGGTSEGDPGAGGSLSFTPDHKSITTADKAGAGILTSVFLAGIIMTFAWMSTGWNEPVA